MKFILHWRTGRTETIEGANCAEAMTLAGYGGGILAALDYWEEAPEEEAPAAVLAEREACCKAMCYLCAAEVPARKADFGKWVHDSGKLVIPVCLAGPIRDRGEKWSG